LLDRRRLRLAAMVFLLLLAGIGPVYSAAEISDYEQAIQMILCDCGCHPQSVKECACGRAAEMRSEIAALVEHGVDGRGGPMTGEQVIEHYVASHGEKIRIAPTAEGFNLIPWLGPFVALAAMFLMVGLALRRWRRQHPGDPAAATVPAATSAGDEAYVERLRRELQEME